MRVPVEMPERVWWRLASIAEDRDTTVAELLGGVVQSLVGRGDGSRSEMARDSVAVRWRWGWTDREIARDLGWTNAAVAERRRALGLPANRTVKRKAADAVRKGEAA